MTSPVQRAAAWGEHDELVDYGAMAAAPTAGGPVLGAELVPLDTIEASLDRGEPDTLLAGIRHAGPLAVCGLVANGVNVVITVLVAHLITGWQYGELNQLVGLFFILSMPGSAVLVGVVRRATALSAMGDDDAVRRFAATARRVALVGVIVLAVVAVAAGGAIGRALNVRDPAAVAPIVTAGAVWILLSIDRGMVQARQAYGALGSNLLVEAGARTLGIVVLTSAGFGVTGAALGIMGAELVAAAHARSLAHRLWRVDGPPVEVEPTETGGDAGRLGVDVAVAAASLSLLAVLQYVDIILLGRAEPKASGSYAAISVASKGLVFGAVVLGGYLLPEAAIRARQGRHSLRPLAVAGLVVAAPAALLMLIALAAPNFLLDVVFNHLDADAPAFATLVGAMVFLSATVLLTNYLLGAGWRWVALVLLVGAVVATVAIAAAHGQPEATARADLVVQAGIALSVGACFAVVHHRVRRR